MRHLAALVPFALLAGLTLPAYAGTISIEGRGEVAAAPDMAMVNSGVTTQGATAREALDANTAAMADLIAALKGSGIADRDIQTSGFSVNPNYVYSDERDANGYTMPPKINGYQVSNTVTIKVRDLDQLGAILDQSVTVGANTVNGVSFSVADPSALSTRRAKPPLPMPPPRPSSMPAPPAARSMKSCRFPRRRASMSRSPTPCMLEPRWPTAPKCRSRPVN